MGRAAFDIHEVIQGLGLKDVIVAGWSLGVTMVLPYVDLLGENSLAGLCLISGASYLLTQADWPHGFLSLQEAEQYRFDVEDHCEQTISAVVPQLFRTPPPEYDELLSAALRAGPPTGQAAIIWSGVSADFRTTLHGVRSPLLVVLGRHDPLVPASNATVFAELVPRARVEIFDESGHSPFLEESERFNTVALDFVKDAAGS